MKHLKMCLLCFVNIYTYVYVPVDHLWHFITWNWIHLLEGSSYLTVKCLKATLLSLLTMVHCTCYFDYTVYNMFQVDPRKHRLLLEVFDENRLVSYLVVFNLSDYNLYYTERFNNFSFELVKYFLQNILKCIFVFTEFWWIPNVEGLFHVRAATNDHFPYELICDYFLD